MKVSSYRGFEVWSHGGYFVAYMRDILIGRRMTIRGVERLIDVVLQNGGFTVPYTIVNLDSGESKKLNVTEKDLIGEYGSVKKPKPTFVKELAFKRGLFSRSSWRANKKLAVRRTYR